VEFFRNTNIDFLGKKWYFLTFSLVFSVAGVLSMAFWHGIPLGVDFRGGTLVYVKYAHTPDPSAIHNEIERAGLKNARVQRYGQPGNNEVLIALDIQETSEQALDKVQNEISEKLYNERLEPAVREYLKTLRQQSYVIIKPGYQDIAGGGNSEIQEVSATPEVVKTKKGHKKYVLFGKRSGDTTTPPATPASATSPPAQ